MMVTWDHMMSWHHMMVTWCHMRSQYVNLLVIICAAAHRMYMQPCSQAPGDKAACDQHRSMSTTNISVFLFSTTCSAGGTCSQVDRPRGQHDHVSIYPCTHTHTTSSLHTLSSSSLHTLTSSSLHTLTSSSLHPPPYTHTHTPTPTPTLSPPSHIKWPQHTIQGKLLGIQGYRWVHEAGGKVLPPANTTILHWRG